ncbi:hypothetical protein CTI14_06020 [Methylobacterium radiotolerans]|nr:hypothetical protein CTI14_06020 [Methylobacterium radiotolerans]
MDRQSLLFVDHIFHKKTRSFDFVKQILSDRFEIEEIFVDPELPISIDFRSIAAEYVVLAQVDFLTHIFLSLGKRVIVIQMYDGSGWLPDEHWRLNRQARYINFSQSLHARITSLGCESLLLKFAPDPSKYKKQTDFESLRLFFWNRLPGSPVNCERVGRLLKGQLESCHIHLSRDDGLPPETGLERFFDCSITTSEWFENKSELEAILDHCNVFIAPRVAEGIGHAFLEAMARGMIVLAWDMPTHSEYISTWYNGILYHPETDHIELRSGPDLSLMGAQARFAIEQDFREWEARKTKIVDYVQECMPAVVPTSKGLELDLAKFAPAYQEGAESYRRALRSSAFSIEILEKWRDFEGRKSADPTQPTRLGDTFVFLGLAKEQGFELDGFSLPEGTHIWSNQLFSRVNLPAILLPAEKDKFYVTVEMASFGKNAVEIVIQDISAGKIILDRTYREYTFPVSAENIILKSLVIGFKVDRLSRVRKGDARDLGCKINYIRIHSNPGETKDFFEPIDKSKSSKIGRILRFGSKRR